MSKQLPVITADMYTRSMHKLDKPSLLASSDRRTKVVRPTPENPLIISASELSEFLRCRVKHHWGYQCKLQPISSRVPLVMGSKGHEILERYYLSPVERRTPKRINAIAKKIMAKTSVKELPAEDKELLTAMVTGYSRYFNDKNVEYSDPNIGVGQCWPEDSFILPLVADGSILVRGKLDVRFFPSSLKNTVGTLESKFKKTISYDNVENMLQLSVYLWALRMKFPKMKRFVVYYQILRKQLPGPRVKAALYYRDMIERDADEVDQWALDAGRQALDMLDGAVYPNPQDSCSWSCDFRDPCLLRGDKSGLKHVLTTQYQRRPDYGK